MSTTAATSVQSHEEVTQLASGNVVLQAKYGFANPYSINGPFGTLEVTITEDAAGMTAFGKVTIQTLYGMGTETTFQYSGPATFNGSTGYTSVSTQGKGIMYAWPNPPKPITAEIAFDLAPTFKSGTLSVEGFFEGYALTPTASTQVG